MGRIEYFIPNKDIFQDHLANHCTYLTREARAEFKEVSSLLSEEKKTAYKSQCDYGSLYEAVQFPKYANLKQDIQPGSASPARIFAAHEATLLERAQKRKGREVYNSRHKQKKADAISRDTTELSEALGYDPDDFEEPQRLGNYNNQNAKEDIQLDTSSMYDVDADPTADELELPSGTLLSFSSLSHSRD